MADMGLNGQRSIPIWKSWRCFVGLSLLLFFIRATEYLVVMPPFEGWDEYQHVAYLQYLVEHNSLPERTSDVPPSLYDELVKYPHPVYGADQLKAVGAQCYEDFWREGVARGVLSAQPIRLYQSQHPPMYYLLTRGIYQPFRDRGLFLEALTLLRLANVLLGLLTIGAFAFALERLLPDGIERRVPLLLLVSQPLFLVNTVRVANDALAIFFGVAAVVVILVWFKRYPLRTSSISGVLIGLGLLTKGVIAPLVPAFFIYFTWMAIRRRVPGGIGFVSSILFVATMSLVIGGYVVDNMNKYGIPIPLDDVLTNQETGKESDLLQAAQQVEWFSEFEQRYSRDLLFVGGWSMLRPVQWGRIIHGCLLLLGLIGLLVELVRHGMGRKIHHTSLGMGNTLIWLVLSLVPLFMGAHMVVAKATYVFVITNFWYALVSVPWLLLVIVQGWLGLGGRRLVWLLGGISVLLFFIVEQQAILFQMLPYYTQAQTADQMKARLAEMHLTYLSPQLLPWLIGTSLFLALWGIGLSACPKNQDRSFRSRSIQAQMKEDA